MPQTQIIPKYVNAPRGNARSATVKDDQGGYWGIHPGDMGKFQVGVPVTIDYTVRTGQDGKSYYNVTSIVGGLGQAPTNPQANFQPLKGRIETKWSDTPRPFQADPRKSEDIFVCGVVNSAISHQSYLLDPSSLATLVRNARAAWRDGEPNAQSQSEAPPPESEEDYYRA